MNKFLRNFCCLELAKCFTIFYFNWNFWKINFFSISIVLFIALKRWNFPDNLDFKGKIGATFLSLSLSLSLSLYVNLTKKKKKKKETKNKQIKYGTVQKVCYLHNGFFHPIQLFVTLYQFYSNTFPVLFTKIQ